MIEETKRNDKEVLNKIGYNLRHASEELRNDKEVVLEAVKKNGYNFTYASKMLKNDKEVVLEAVKQSGDSLRYASKTLKNDKEVVLEAVKQSGYSLRYASEELRNDREVVLEAVKQRKGSLQYASEELRNDREVVLEAVKQDGYSLQYASEELRNDREVVLEAVKQRKGSLQYASEELKNDREVVKQFMDYLQNEIKQLERSFGSNLIEKLKKSYYKSYKEKIVSKDASMDNDYDFLKTALTSNILESIYSNNNYTINDTRFLEASLHLYSKQIQEYCRNLMKKHIQKYREKNLCIINELFRNINNPAKVEEIMLQNNLNKSNIYEFVINNKYFDKKIKTACIETLNQYYNKDCLRAYDIFMILEEMIERKMTIDQILETKEIDKGLFEKIYKQYAEKNPLFYQIIKEKLEVNKIRGFRKFMKFGYLILDTKVNSIEEFKTLFNASPYEILKKYKKTNIYESLLKKISNLNGYNNDCYIFSENDSPITDSKQK